MMNAGEAEDSRGLPRHRRRPLGTCLIRSLMLLVMFAMVLGPAEATAMSRVVQPGPPSNRDKVYIYYLDLWSSGGIQTLHVRPKEIPLDNHDRLGELDWSRWGRKTTVSRGIFFYDDCDPNCAEGTGHEYDVRLRASHIRHCKVAVYSEDGVHERVVRVYNRLTVRYIHPDPQQPFFGAFEPACESA